MGTTTLPERETYLASFILRTLRKWKADDAARGRTVWYVADIDLDYLEQETLRLWEAYQATEDKLNQCGVEIVKQPSLGR